MCLYDYEQVSYLPWDSVFSTVGAKTSCAVVVKWGNSAGLPMGDTTLSSPFFNPGVSWLLFLSPCIPMWQAIHTKQSDSQPLASVLKGDLSKSSYQSFKLLLSALTSAPLYPDTWEWTEALGLLLAHCLPVLPAAALVHATVSDDTLGLVGGEISIFSTWAD